MAVAFSVASVTGVADGGAPTQDSASTVVPAGATVYVAVESSDNTALNPIGVAADPTGANQALTQVGTTIDHSSPNAKFSLWRIHNPNAGTYVFRATWSGNQGERVVSVYVATGSDGTHSGLVQNTGTNGTPTTGAITTTAGDWVVAFGGHLHGSGSSVAYNSPTGTERAEGLTSGTPYDGSASQDTTAAGSSTTLQWTLSVTPSSWAMFGLVINAGSSATLDQEGFRFGVDDATESAHTWAQAQDTSDTVTVGTARLIRALIDATGDPASTAYTLRYQKNGAGGYVPVPVGSGNPTTIGAPAYNSLGAAANVTTSSGSLAVNYPSMTGATTDTALYLVISGRHSTANTAETAPGGWTLVGSLEGGTGTFGADAGTRRVAVYRKDSVTGSESGSVSVSYGGTTSSTIYGSIVRVDPPSAGYVLSETFTTGQDSTAGTAVSITGSGTLDYDAAGDLLLVCHASPSDTGGVVGSPSLTATGSTFGSLTSLASIAVTGGNDHRHVIYSAVVTAAGSAAAPTFAYTASGTSSGNACGPAVFVRIRATLPAVTNEVYVDASANIAAGGEATTARLTAPSGKSTSDFVTGRRWDDENGTDSIDITTDDYTEVEWRVTTQSPAANGDYFDFRVYAGASALSSYTVTPRLTLADPPVDIVPLPGAEPQAADLLSYDASPYSLDWVVNVAVIVNTRTATASLGTAVQAAQAATASLSTAVQASNSATASLGTSVQVANSASASLQAAVQAGQSASASLNTYIQAGSTANASLDVAIQTGRTATASLSAAVQLAQAASASLGTAIQVGQSATASLQAAIQAANSATASFSAYVQAGTSIGVSLDVAVQQARTATASLSAAIATASTATAAMGAAIALPATATSSLSAAVQYARTATASLNAYVDDPTVAVYTGSSRVRVGLASTAKPEARIGGKVAAILNGRIGGKLQ